MSDEPKIELHQFTHDGDKVLFVRRCDANMHSYNNFEWPKQGPVAAPDWRDDTSCGGGLHGWPWGIGVGIGSDLEHGDVFQVVAASPDVVRSIEFGKCKFKEGEVVLTGTLAEAMLYTVDGRVAWVQQNSDGSASATGWSGSASATGESGSASATGWSGSASATGWSGSASATGESGSASATGESGSASATGGRGSASATGGMSVAALTGPEGLIEVGPSDLGAVFAEQFTWTVRLGAVVVQRWREAVEGNSEQFAYPFRVLDSVGLRLEDGKIYKIVKGEIQHEA